MNKTDRPSARRLSDAIGKALNDAFRRQGFAGREIVTRWTAIAGEEIAALAEPVGMQWPRHTDPEDGAPGTLVLRVDGPVAIEIQHQSAVIVERVNRFFGWRAVDRIALRQAPLRRRRTVRPRLAADPEAARHEAERLTGIADEPLRRALGRLGAAVKRK